MKKIFTLFLCFTTIISFSQAPQGLNYQAKVSDSFGTLLLNHNINFKFNIVANAPTATPIYSETHNVLSDDLGHVSLVIGTGAATLGTFSTIDWSTGNYFLGIEVNTGSGFVTMGTTQLLPVPFSLYAQNAENVITLPNGLNIGDVLTWNGTQWASPQSVPILNLPTLETNTVSSISANSAISGGTILNDGGFAITSKGICWSTNQNPTILDNITNNGTGSSVFASNMLNLLAGTTYYYSAYATNSNGTGYGPVFSFSTLNIPTLLTIAPTKITRISIYTGGIAVSDGGSTVSEKGMVWSTTPNPTIALTTKTTEGGGLLNFIKKITGLSEYTTYYLRAYATNAIGTAYGNVVVFKTANMEGIYNVIQGEYWRIGVYRPDVVWTGQVREIELVSSTLNATTYRFKEYVGPFGSQNSNNTHYFTINANGLVQTPVAYNGVGQILNTFPVINCAETPANMTNACLFVGPQNVIVKNDVNGKDKIYRSYGYLNPTGPREFYEVLERIVD